MRFHDQLLIIFMLITGKNANSKSTSYCHSAFIWDPPFCCHLACAQEIQMNFNMSLRKRI